MLIIFAGLLLPFLLGYVVTKVIDIPYGNASKRGLSDSEIEANIKKGFWIAEGMENDPKVNEWVADSDTNSIFKITTRADDYVIVSDYGFSYYRLPLETLIVCKDDDRAQWKIRDDVS